MSRHSRRRRHEWTVYPPNYKPMDGNYVVYYSKFQMKKTMARLGFGSTAEYVARLFFRDGSWMLGNGDALSVARGAKDNWTNAIEVVRRDILEREDLCAETA